MDFLALSAGMQHWECTRAGWIWYCDLHDTHGNADFKEEAEAVSAAHAEFMFDGEEPCDIYVVKIEPPAEDQRAE